jgi:serine phosphatase RsbU (regulator of sigma subunit)
MRKFVNFIDQTRFVQSMNGQFAELSKTGNFATAVVTTFFAPTNRLSLCNAGHPPPLIYHAAEGRWQYLEHADSEDENPSNLPFGILDLSTTTSTTSICSSATS